MGNEQCNECRDTQIENQAYGAHEVLQEGDNIMAVVVKLVDGDQTLKRNVCKQLDIRMGIKHMNIVKLYGYNIINEKYGFKTVMNFEYLPKTLRDRSIELLAKGEDPCEREIFSLVYGVEEGLLELQEHNIKHCCINMETILCKKSLYKITDMSSTTYVTSYDLAKKGNRYQFLSEKLLNNMYSKALCPTYELKDDFFSLGMVALAFSTGKNAENFYTWDKGNISMNVKAIDSNLRELKRKFSSKLVKKIKSLIFSSEEDIQSSVSTSLTENLVELDQQMTRVMRKASKIRHLDSTFQCTPEQKESRQISSFSTSPYKEKQFLYQ